MHLSVGRLEKWNNDQSDRGVIFRHPSVAPDGAAKGKDPFAPSASSPVRSDPVIQNFGCIPRLSRPYDNGQSTGPDPMPYRPSLGAKLHTVAAIVNVRVCSTAKCKPSHVPAARSPRRRTIDRGTVRSTAAPSLRTFLSLDH